jgi:hypothetical protein
MLVRSSLALVVVLGATGCVSPYSYQPANSPRVSVAQDAIHKNGKRYGLLVDALADNPRALEEARAARSMAIPSTWLLLGGAGLGGAGVVLAATHRDETITGLSLIGGCIVAEIVAAVMAGKAQAHSLNAVNIYNDDVEAKMFVRRPAPMPAEVPAPPTSEPP